MSILDVFKSTWKKLAGSTTDVVILFDPPNTQIAAAYVGKSRLSFNTDNKATIALTSGVHVLAWGLEGQPGAEYKIEIMSPEKAKWKPQQTPKIDPDGKAGGAHQFQIGE